jgi:hypothetical protein
MKSLPGTCSASPNARLSITTALLELARANLSNLAAAQKIALELSLRQNEVVMGVAKNWVGGSSPAALVVDVFERSVNSLIEVHRHFLDLYIPVQGEEPPHRNPASPDAARTIDVVAIKQ